MKKICLLAWIVLCYACISFANDIDTTDEQTQSDKKSIMVSSVPLASLTKSIVGDYAKIDLLIDEHSCPDHAEILPSKIPAIQLADLILYSSDTMHHVSKYQQYMKSADVLHAIGGDDIFHTGHMWMSINISIKMAHEICDHVTMLYNDKSIIEDIKSNMRRLESKLNDIAYHIRTTALCSVEGIIASNDLLYIRDNCRNQENEILMPNVSVIHIGEHASFKKFHHFQDEIIKKLEIAKQRKTKLYIFATQDTSLPAIEDDNIKVIRIDPDEALNDSSKLATIHVDTLKALSVSVRPEIGE